MLLGRHPLWGAGATLILKSWVKALPKEQLSCHIYFVYAPAHGGLPAQLSGGLCKSLGFISDPLLVVNLSAGPVTLWELLGPLLHVIGDARAFLTLLHNTRLQLLRRQTGCESGSGRSGHSFHARRPLVLGAHRSGLD